MASTSSECLVEIDLCVKSLLFRSEVTDGPGLSIVVAVKPHPLVEGATVWL